MASATLSVRLELDAEPISGEVTAPGVQARVFNGWIELFASLEGTLESLRGSATSRRECE